MSTGASGATRRPTGEHEAGKSCPYCRFPLKSGAEAAICSGCRAVHHAECWTDNGGCAVMGCSNAPTSRPATHPAASLDPLTLTRPPTPPRLPRPPADELSPARSSRGAPGRGLTLAVVVLAAAVAGVAAALLLQNRAGSALPPTQQASGPAGASSAAGGGATGEAPTPGSTSTAGAETGSVAVPSTPTATTGTGTTSTQTTGSSTGAHASGGPPLTAYTGQGFSMSYPAGWAADQREQSHGSYVESHWHLPGRPEVSLLIDHSVGVVGTPKQGADPVRLATVNEPGYQELAYQGESQTPGPAQVWLFILGGKEKVDTFFSLCGTGYAILGAAPVAEFSQYEATFAAVTQSLAPGACATN